MSELILQKKMKFSASVMIAGWPGMGSVALSVVDYLKTNLSGIEIGEIKTDQEATVDSVVVEDGMAQMPPAPKNVLYYVKDAGIVIFEGEAQLSGAAGIELMNRLLDFAAENDIKRIFTGAAFPAPISHKEHPRLYAAVNKKTLIKFMEAYNIEPMDGGHISGMNGLILGFAQKRAIEAVCILATMPQYAISLPNPRASFAILDALRRILRFDLSLKDMEEYIKEMDEKMAMIEDKVKDVMVERKFDTKTANAEEKPVPPYIIEKVERLFHEARKDRTKAIILKKELDRWDLYKRYEDRFLDLFKDSQ